MIDDLILDNEDSGAAKPGPAFVVLPPVTLAELLVLEAMHRDGGNAEFRGDSEMLFTTFDDDGRDIWETDPCEATRWRKLMSWPRDPTIEEAMAFKLNAEARLRAKWHTRIMEARAIRP